MATCARCGGYQPQEMIDVTSLGSVFSTRVPGRNGECTSCGWYGPPVTFRPYHMKTPLKFITTAAPGIATWFESGIGEVVMAQVEFVTVHAGPPADLPAIPTPDDLLRSAGLGHLVAKPDPACVPDDEDDPDDYDWG